METKQIEMKSIKTVYVAVDGTEFDDKEQCEKYDKSALGIIKGRVNKLAVKITNAWDAVGGDEEHELWIVVPKKAEDVVAIGQLLSFYGNKQDTGELDEQIGKPIFLIWDYDQDYIWFRTLESIVKYASEA